MKALSKFQNLKRSFPNDQTPVILLKFLCPGSLLDIKEKPKQTKRPQLYKLQSKITPCKKQIESPRTKHVYPSVGRTRYNFNL